MRTFVCRSFFAGKKTQLYDMHVAKKGKIVEFAGTWPQNSGYQMPVQYPTGIIKEHLHCR